MLENQVGGTFDEIAVTQSKAPLNQVCLVQGRASVGGESLSINLDISTGTEQTMPKQFVSARIRSKPISGKKFGDVMI